MGEFTYLDGELTPTGEACISVYDRGFLFGDGLFELIRTYDGKPFMVDAHLDRLQWGARKLKYTSMVAPDTIKNAIKKTVDANGYPESLIRLIVTRGSSKAGKMSIVVMCDEFKGFPAGHYERGVDVVTVTDSRSDLQMVNSLNQLPSRLAKYEAKAKNAFEAIFVTKKGFITQGASSHVFVVLDDILITPPLERVVPGITREIVRDLAEQAGIRTKEDAVITEEVRDAEEAFLTSQPYEIMPIASFDGERIGSGPGSITERLSTAYRRFVRDKA